MRVFKFWRISETTVVINDMVKTISCFGGSNHSETDALTDGHRRLEAVKRRIAGTEKRKGLDYEADIREEPLLWMHSGIQFKEPKLLHVSPRSGSGERFRLTRGPIS